MAIKKILVGTDFSEPAKVAIEHAVQLAIRDSAELVLIHAINLSMHREGDPYFATMPEGYFTRIKDLQAELRAKLAEEMERLRSRGLNVSMVYEDHEPELAIVRVANELKVDLIVLGCQGRSGLSRFLVGSVSESVAKNAECDVLIARSQTTGPFARVLVPTDFSEYAETAIKRAIELAEPGGTIELFHCWKLPGGVVTYLGPLGKKLHDSSASGAEASGAELIRKYPSETATLHFTQKDCDAREGIEERVKKGDIDLVVMGTRGRTGLKRFLLGSIAQSTIRHSPTSVYLAR